MVNCPISVHHCLPASEQNVPESTRACDANLFVVVILGEYLHVLGIGVEDAAPIAGVPAHRGHGPDNTVLAA